MAVEDGSNRVKTAIDWQAAFAFYASLPPRSRTYAAVAAEFAVSPRTVESHGRIERWQARLREIEASAAREADLELVDRRVEELRKMGRLIDASLIEYANKLRVGEVRMTPADLERLHRLQQQLTDELATPFPTIRDEPYQSARTPEHTAAVIDALAEAGALETLGLTRSITPAPESTPANGEGESV
jgi:hypothetical protein